MLHRIHLVQGVGLFHDAKASKHKLEKTTLIYAGNGRGKSTLSSLFRSVSNNDVSILQERRTIDGTLDPMVKLQFDNNCQVSYTNGTWTEGRPEFRVFDTVFIENNVHSGGEISTEHRKNLLDFAIGDSAVTSKKAEEKAFAERKQASADIRAIEQQLTAYADGKPLPVFRLLEITDEADEKRAELDRRRADAISAATTLSQPAPSRLKLPHIDIPEVFNVLNATIDDVHVEAESVVSEHLSKLEGGRAASWLSEGQQFDDHLSCPYCGQSTEDLPLIRMYQFHFNHAYKLLKESVAEAVSRAQLETSPLVLSSLLEQRKSVNEKLAAWKHLVDVEEISSEFDELAFTSFQNLRELLTRILLEKSLDPLEQRGFGNELTEATRLWAQFTRLFSDQNDLIDEYCQRIDSYKDSLQKEDVRKLSEEIDRIDLAKTRHSGVVVQLFSELHEAEARLQKAESDKQAARTELDALMESTLERYRADINKYLRNLGAAFSINEFRTNYYGGTPRSDYGLTLRGQTVELAGGQPSFATALSEGDKRTLAFAFFVASTLSDPDIAQRVVVVDDPVSSLDRSRREYTTKLLGDISKKCSQLILLAHDATFLRDTFIALSRENSSMPVTFLQIDRAPNNYSHFRSVDLDRECETQYYTDYRTVDEFVHGGHSDAHRAAVALRPLLEGYLHRRFPNKISSRSMLGKAITQIQNAEHPNPLVHMRDAIDELRELNDFACLFHHNTNPGYDSHQVDPDAVLVFGRRVLDIVHGART